MWLRRRGLLLTGSQAQVRPQAGRLDVGLRPAARRATSKGDLDERPQPRGDLDLGAAERRELVVVAAFDLGRVVESPVRNLATSGSAYWR